MAIHIEIIGEKSDSEVNNKTIQPFKNTWVPPSFFTNLWIKGLINKKWKVVLAILTVCANKK